MISQRFVIHGVLRGADGVIEVRLGPAISDPWMTWPSDRFTDPQVGDTIVVRLPQIIEHRPTT